MSSIIVPAVPAGNLTCEPWATTADVCSPCTGGAFTDDVLEECLQAASDILFMLAGRRYPGVCTDTIRPIWSEPPFDVGRPIRSGWAGLTAGAGFGYGYGYGTGLVAWWASPGRCEGVSEIPLPGTPVGPVVYVKVDGVVLDPARYRVDDDRTLVRLPDADGTRPGWPTRQDLTLPATEPGTWEVQYRYGSGPPPAGVRAAAELGCQLALACDPGTAGECRLPERVQHITRQGLDAVVLDPLAFIDQGRTGLVECDYFLQSANPEKSHRPASVWRPGAARTARRTGT